MDALPDLDELRRQFTDRMTEFTSLHKRLQELSASATSPQRLVTATVGAQGEVTALKFHSDGYRSMAQSELEHVLLDTIKRARRHVMDQMKDLVGPLAPVGASIDDILEGRFDPVDLTSGQVFQPRQTPSPRDAYDEEE
jgi:DNA-binding protein YbaB